MFDDRTQEVLKQEMLDMVAQQSQVATMPGSYADATLGAAAFLLSEFYQTLPSVPAMLFVDETSGPYIDLVGETYFNITRRAGTRARCGVTLSGLSGTRIPQGTVFLTQAGLEFETLTEVYIQPSGSVYTTLQAVEVGSVYNIEAHQLTKMYVNLAGLESYDNEAATGGTDEESDELLLQRIQERRAMPANGANGWSYRQWAMTVAGVGDAKVVELAGGSGTVGVTIVDTQWQPASAEILQACKAALEEQRAVGAAVLVDVPETVEVQVEATVTISTSTSKDQVQRTLEEKLAEYMGQLVGAKYGQIYYNPAEDVPYTLPYSRVLVALLTIDGVEDYASLQINGDIKDIQLGVNQVPVLGEVVVH